MDSNHTPKDADQATGSIPPELLNFACYNSDNFDILKELDGVEPGSEKWNEIRASCSKEDWEFTLREGKKEGWFGEDAK